MMVSRMTPDSSRSRTAILRIAAVLACGLVWGGGFCGQAASAADPGSSLLEMGIEPTAEGISEYLVALHPTPETVANVKRLIVLLGDDDFRIREDATRRLLRSPQFPKSHLTKAADGPDPEVRWRARQILRIGESQAEQTLFQVFSYIRKQKLPGLSRPVLAALPVSSRDYVQQEGIRAFVETVTPADKAWLPGETGNPSANHVIAVARGIDRLWKAEAVEKLAPLLQHEEESVRLAVARLNINHNDRRTLPVVSRLLRSEDLKIRTQAIQVLRAVTGQKYGYLSYSKPDERLAAIDKWDAWLKANGEKAELNLPLDETGVMLGRTLICYYSRKQIVEVDSAGKVIFEKKDVEGAWGCDGTPNGHRVICSYSKQKIFEYDNDGKIVWQVDNTPGRPFAVERLPDGNTLIACYDTGKLVEYSPDKKIAWQMQINGQPMDVRRLPNGNLLVSLYQSSKVVEIDRETKEVKWEITANRPRAAQRLPNSHTLVVEPSSQRVVEYDMAGKIVWKKEGISNPTDAQRMPGGTTLIAGSKGVIEIDMDGKTVWERKETSASRLCRY